MKSFFHEAQRYSTLRSFFYVIKKISKRSERNADESDATVSNFICKSIGRLKKKITTSSGEPVRADSEEDGQCPLAVPFC